MGQLPTRITAADFITPPEFRGLTLATETTGRIGGVCLQLSQAGAETRIGNSYQQIPLRFLPLQIASRQAALVYLLNPTAGLLDGDGHFIHVEAKPGAQALVVGQSANRIHPSIGGFSTQQWRITVHGGATLIVLPGPTIPFRGCRHYSRAEIDLHEDSRFIWGDVWLPGRHEEQFCFDRIVQEFLVRRAGRLVYRDRFCWQGPWDKETALWHFSGQAAYGSVFMTGMLGPDLKKARATKLGAVFATAAKDSAMRWLGPSDLVTACVVKAALSAGRNTNNDENPFRCLLSSNHLASNHWFTPQAGDAL